MGEQRADRDFFEKFNSDMVELDDQLTSRVLKTHLLIERDLDRIIEAIFIYPLYILKGMPFERKVRSARAMARDADKLPYWDVILRLNALRNALAHGASLDDRQRRVEELRKACSSIVREGSPFVQPTEPPSNIILLAGYLGSDFLAQLADQLRDLRKHIDASYDAKNADGKTSDAG